MPQRARAAEVRAAFCSSTRLVIFIMRVSQISACVAAFVQGTLDIIRMVADVDGVDSVSSADDEKVGRERGLVKIGGEERFGKIGI